MALHWTCTALHQRIATYWHLLPEASQARKAIWDAINPNTGKRRIDEAFPIELRAATREQEMMIRFLNGSTWQVVGSDNYNSLVGSPPAGVVYSEWALANPLSWGYLRPILAENGGWALFIYTPRGRNHGSDLYEAAAVNPEWFAERLTVEDTGHISPERIAAELKEYAKEYGPEMGKALFNQEYYCSFDAANIGSVYADWVNRAENEGRVTDVPYEPGAPVNTYWDMGFGDATSIWMGQMIHDEIHLIDFYESTGQGIDKDCEALAARGYKTWGQHFMPHDAVHKLKAAHGRSLANQAQECGFAPTIVPATSQANQIAVARKIFPKCWFDKTKCEYGIKALRNYHYSWDSNRKVLGDAPVHDWSSNCADAFEIIGQTDTNTVYPLVESKPRFLHEITANEMFFPEKQGIKHRERI